MKYIELTQDKVAVVDDEDYEILSQWKWYAQKDYKNNNFYALTRIDDKVTSMHRFIMKFPHKLQVDHIDRDGLNNQKSNLRIATYAQNGSNKTAYKSNKTGYKGVCRHGNRYVAQIKNNGKVIYLGQFESPASAAKAYNLASQKLQGEFSYQNPVK